MSFFSIIDVNPAMKDIDKLRPIIFKIALALVLAICVLTINLTTVSPVYRDGQLDIYDERYEVMETTHHREKKEQKEVETTSKNKIVDPEKLEDEIEFVEEPVDSIFTPPDSMATGVMKVPGKTKPASPAPVVEPFDKDTPIKFPDKMPVFGDCPPGDDAERRLCSEKALLTFLRDNISYPKLAAETGISGTVVVQFVVQKDGTVSDVAILADPGGGCGAEARRVVESMPVWSPGIRRDKPVPVVFTLPVRFILN